MPQPPLPSLNRLNKLEKTHARERRVFFIWKDLGDTPADVEAKRDRLIAEGTARALTTNSFTSVGAARMKNDRVARHAAINIGFHHSTQPGAVEIDRRVGFPVSDLLFTGNLSTQTC